MTEEIHVVEPTTYTIQLDPSQWSYTDFLRFTKLSNQNKTVEAYAVAQQIIANWDYDISLDDPNALAKLPLGEGGKVIRTISETLTKAIEGMSVNDVKVDFAKAGWNALKWEEFIQALVSFNGARVTELLHEVAVHPDVKPGDTTLPLMEGAAMVRAVRERYTKIMQGKY